MAWRRNISWEVIWEFLTIEPVKRGMEIEVGGFNQFWQHIKVANDQEGGIDAVYCELFYVLWIFN